MDVPRQKPKRHRVAMTAGGTVLVLAAALGISRMNPAAPGVERSTLLIDRVERGEMVRDVRGSGELVPQDLRIVSAMTAGRVDVVRVQPGARVDANEVLIEMSNPDVQLQWLDAERQVTLAEADLASLRASLENDRLAAVGSVASARTAASEAERGIKVAERLQAESLNSGMDVDRARDAAVEAHARLASEQERLRVLTESVTSQVALRQAEVERLKSIASFQRERVASMTVRAGQAGTLQSLSLQPGQWVNPGQELARVAGQDRLKAVVHIPENDARDLTIGLQATVDTHNGVVRAHVARVDPASENGSVGVDLALDGPLPRGARPDLAVDGTIEIDRLRDVLHVGRPADGSSESTVPMFVLEPGGHSAVRRSVRLGRGSADAVEVVSGLNAGDEVILSEMSRWAGFARVQLR